MPTAIEFNHVSKQYRLGLVSTRTLSHDLDRWWKMNILGKEDPYLKIGETNDRATKGASDYVWALKDIDFKVEQGDVVGIIGKNGAGKSTLLKLLSKVTGPTTGSIKARGRIGALLEVGTGFHSEMTGRENIFLNGAILGMSKQEVTRKLDEIVDFSGCERYLDTPVKRYSSGMLVRLGFAVAAHLDPEILVVDEVLAVGDAEFQKKAIGKMQDVSRGEGRTVLFVSHNMSSIRALCKSGVLLDNGMITYQGNAGDVVDKYIQGQISGEIVDRQGSGQVKFIDYSIDKTQLELGEDLQVNLDLQVFQQYFSELIVNVSVVNSAQERMYHASNYDDGVIIKYHTIGEIIHLSCILKDITLAPGHYYITLFTGTHDQIFDHIISCMDFYVEQGTSFIKRPTLYLSNFRSVVRSSWKHVSYYDKE